MSHSSRIPSPAEVGRYPPPGPPLSPFRGGGSPPRPPPAGVLRRQDRGGLDHPQRGQGRPRRRARPPLGPYGLECGTLGAHLALGTWLFHFPLFFNPSCSGRSFVHGWGKWAGGQLCSYICVWVGACSGAAKKRGRGARRRCGWGRWWGTCCTGTSTPWPRIPSRSSPRPRATPPPPRYRVVPSAVHGRPKGCGRRGPGGGRAPEYLVINKPSSIPPRGPGSTNQAGGSPITRALLSVGRRRLPPPILPPPILPPTHQWEWRIGAPGGPMPRA